MSKSNMVILSHVDEQKNVFKDHFELAKRAFPGAAPIVWQGSPPNLRGKVVIKTGNSYYLGTPQFKALAKELRRAKQVFIVVNDYTSPPPTQVRDAIRGRYVVALTTLALHTFRERTTGRRMWNWFEVADYVDWNRASWRRRPPVECRDPAGVIYWGAMRLDRVERLRRYLKTSDYPVYVSGALRSRGVWEALLAGTRGKWMGRLALDEMPSVAGTTIYLQDAVQDEEYHSVASRFYEAVGRGLLVLVDRRAHRTFVKAGITIEPDWMVTDPVDVADALNLHGVLREEQQRKLVRDYASDAVRQLQDAVRRHT